jgi:hypothetical protein
MELHPVSVKVVYPDGSPVLVGSLECTSIDRTAPCMAKAMIQPDGTFQLETATAEGMKMGAAAGSYRVIVRSPMRSERDLDNWRETVPVNYGSYDSSGLTLTVEPGPNQLELKVRRP